MALYAQKVSDAYTVRMGSLKVMLGLPTDMLPEIMCHLHPQDLLSLSWSSKSFHQFLMRNSSVYVWKRSYQTLSWQLPFPEGIIEPMFTTLLFTEFCTGCGTCTTKNHPIWEFNLRLCRNCTEMKLVSPLYAAFPGDRARLMKEIPFAIFNSQPRATYLGPLYLKSEVKERVDDWERLMQLGDEDALATFIGKCVLHVHRVPAHVIRCQAWAAKQAQFLEEQRVAIDQQYLRGIISRLQDIGWGNELSHLQASDYKSIRKHRLYNVKQALTDELWCVMRDDIVRYMAKQKSLRLECEHTKNMDRRWSLMHATLKELARHPEARTYNVGMGDIALMPELRELADAPGNVLLDRASFATLKGKFGELDQQWKLDATEQLRNLVVRQQRGHVAQRTNEAEADVTLSKVDVLALATTRFHCSQCNERSVALYYPGVLAHKCLRGPVVFAEESDLYERWIAAKPGMVASSIYDRLTLAVPSEASKRVIRLCFKDPAVVTAEEMDTLDVMFARKNEMSTWRAAILYDDIHKTLTRWRLATCDEVAEAKEMLPEWEKHWCLYSCVVCSRLSKGKPKTFSYGDAMLHLWQRCWRHPEIKSPYPDHPYLERFLPPDCLFAASVITTRVISKAHSTSWH